MDQILWKDDKYGDIFLENREEGLKLKKLFGIKMEGNTVLAGRISGLYDIFTSLGSHINQQKVEAIEWEEDKFCANINLYDGRMRYATTWKRESDLGIVKRTDTITNLSPEPVILYKAMMRYVFAYDEWEAYVQNTRWCYENVGAWNPVHFGGVMLACEGGRTTQGAAPFLALRNGQFKGVSFHLIPNGNWKLSFKTESLGCSQAGEYGYMLEAGQSDEHFAMTLLPGETFSFPEMMIQSLEDGKLWKSAANLQKYFLKTDQERFRIEHPVVYNPWFEHYALLDEKRLKEHVQAAKELGCEVFEIDAGWYGSKEGDWWCQSGDWSEKTDGAFYGKMNDFAQYVKSQGLGFGLWMEPERIGEKTPIYEAHPEYFGKGNGFYYPKLYKQEVYDYIYGQITGLIEKYGLCWMKMDFNYELGEDESFTEFYRYYQAWYRLLNQLKKAYPNTFFEGCAAGGERNDLHTSMTYDGHFLSDNVNCFDMQFTYQQCCLRMPHYRMIKWLVVNPGAKISLYDSTTIEKTDTLITTQHPGAGWDEYERIDPEFACQLTMNGMVGLSGNFIDLTKEQKEIFRKYVAFYKKYRSFYKEAVLYLCGDPKNVGDRTGFYYLQYHKEETDEHLVFSYRFATACNTDIIYLKNLSENAVYQVQDGLTGKELFSFLGKDLMHRGMEVCYNSRHSGRIFKISRK